MKWRDEVPLSDADYAAIRRNVMREVRVPAARRPRIAPLALAAAALIVIAFLILRPTVHENRPPAIATPREAAVPVIRQEPRSQSRAPAIVVAARRQHRHRVRRRQPAIQTAATRIDIQTADPQVRIIWFAR